MPTNRNALIRYKTIDTCLRNRYRRWTLNDLIEACSAALYEYEGIEKGVSRRTIQQDLQVMRSDKLGYNAPIVIRDRKYYTYADPNYSITNIPLSGEELTHLANAVEVLRQFKGFAIFDDLRGMVQKLEDRVTSMHTQQEPVINFEKNENLTGLQYLDELYQAIVHKCPLYLAYQPFHSEAPRRFDFHPWFLKEYRNRWFLLGQRDGCRWVRTLALDRIVEVKPSFVAFVENKGFDPEAHYQDVIGVTVSHEQPTEEVIFWVNSQEAPYLITKPLHPSQKVLQRGSKRTLFSLRVKMNFELEREILGLGEAVQIVGPEKLKEKIQRRLAEAQQQYEVELEQLPMSEVEGLS